jgi:3-hydroxyacyl-[acyl-carrier-protein] dehydratase
MMQLDFEQIKELIPQRFPFIMIDRVLEIEPGKHAIAVKNVSGSDVFIPGHFPEKAIMPGALIIEAMAQTAIILFAYSKQQEILTSLHLTKEDKNNPPIPPLEKGGEGGFEVLSGVKNSKKPLYYFGSVKAGFLHPVVPGDQIKIKVVNVKSLPNNAYVSAEAFVADIKVSEAELAFSVKYEE